MSELNQLKQRKESLLSTVGLDIIIILQLIFDASFEHFLFGAFEDFELGFNECFPAGPLALFLTGVLVSRWQPTLSSMFTSVRGTKTGYVRQRTKSKMADNHEKARMVKTPLIKIETSSNCIY